MSTAPVQTEHILRDLGELLRREGWHRAGFGSRRDRADTRRQREHVEAQLAQWGDAYELNDMFNLGHRVGLRAGRAEATR